MSMRQTWKDTSGRSTEPNQYYSKPWVWCHTSINI